MYRLSWLKHWCVTTLSQVQVVLSTLHWHHLILFWIRPCLASKLNTKDNDVIANVIIHKSKCWDTSKNLWVNYLQMKHSQIFMKQLRWNWTRELISSKVAAQRRSKSIPDNIKPWYDCERKVLTEKRNMQVIKHTNVWY